MMPAEIKSPAITARGQRGSDGVGEGTTAGGCVIAGEDPWVTVAFASSRVVKEEFVVGELVEVSVNVAVNGAVPVNGVPVKFATGAAGLERRIRSITFFRIAVIFSLLEIPAETILLADMALPSFFINEAT